MRDYKFNDTKFDPFATRNPHQEPEYTKKSESQKATSSQKPKRTIKLPSVDFSALEEQERKKINAIRKKTNNKKAADLKELRELLENLQAKRDKKRKGMPKKKIGKKTLKEFRLNDIAYIIPMLMSIYEGDDFSFYVGLFKATFYTNEYSSRSECYEREETEKKRFVALITRKSSEGIIRKDPKPYDIQFLTEMINAEPLTFLILKNCGNDSCNLNEQKICFGDIVNADTNEPYASWFALPEAYYKSNRVKYITSFLVELGYHMASLNLSELPQDDLRKFLFDYARNHFDEILEARKCLCPFEEGKTEESVISSINEIKPSIPTRGMPVPSSNINE